MPVQIDVFTLFPHWFDWFRGQRHVANAIALGSSVDCVDYRAHTPLRAGQVDDTPFGGGAGMVLRVDVVEAALRARYGEDPVELRSRRRIIALTPGGRVLDDGCVDELAAEESLTLLCGRYEGFDERIVEHFCSESLSIGRYVLAGGELAAMVVCDAVLRKLPGALGSRPLGARGVVLRRAGRRARVPALHAAGRVARLDGPGGAAERTPRPDPGVAGGAVAESRRVIGRRFAILMRRRRQGPVSRGVFFAMSTVIDTLERSQLRRVPAFQAGDRVRVHFQVIEGTRRRTQVFEGVVIKRQGEGVRETFTVRKQSFGVGVERTFPVHSPKIERIEVAARGDVRRAKLYYLRGRVGKRARVRERRYTGPEELVEAGLLHDPAAQAEAAAAAAADDEVPGDAVDQQALDEAEAAEVAAEEPAAEAPAEEPAAEEAEATEAEASDDAK